MNVIQKIKLSGKYGKGLYIISLIMTLSASGLVLSEPILIPACIILKIFSIPVVLYLFASFQKGFTIYFYLNLGISRIEYYALPLAAEFLFFHICMIVSGFIGYAIG